MKILPTLRPRLDLAALVLLMAGGCFSMPRVQAQTITPKYAAGEVAAPAAGSRASLYGSMAGNTGKTYGGRPGEASNPGARVGLNGAGSSHGAGLNLRDSVRAMTLEEKIGQKIMLDFRYWDRSGTEQKDMTAPDAVIGRLIYSNNIGGVILFSNNLKNKYQIKKLTDWYAAMTNSGGAHLLIATDNEGGNVFRLPRNEYASFPGNMATAAAIEGGASERIVFEQGRALAQDLLDLKINTNFAPVADVNANPFNPVINVRAFSDSASVVSRLARTTAAGMKQQGLITTYKHFPGHGSTSTDSHTGLPLVDLSRQEAFAIDLAPYRQAIAAHAAPDMIMTAHIQYPALDESLVTNRNGQQIIVPATMSRAIQTTLLRDQLGYAGVTISDALDMGAITENFSQEDSIEKVFAAGVDIALMPISISSPSQVDLLPRLVNRVAEAVRTGRIKEDELDASVERILELKARHHLLSPTVPQSPEVLPLTAAEIQRAIADQSITVVINRQSLLPLKDKSLRYFILTPRAQQAAGIATALAQQGYRSVVAADEGSLSDAQIRENISRCDVFLLGTLPTSLTAAEQDVAPAAQATVVQDNQNYPAWLQYATSLGKKRVHLSLRAPYDIVDYANYADASVATYSYFGYEDGVWLGPSMIALAEVLTGKLKPRGKLPVNLWHDYDAKTNTGTVAFPRGFGLSWDR
ncbi:beta-N-acetylhexosaminidase [Xanthomonas arboricola]